MTTTTTVATISTVTTSTTITTATQTTKTTATTTTTDLMRCDTIEINFVKSFNYLYQSKMFDNIITYRCRIYCNFSKSNHTYENKSNYQSGVNARFVLMEKREVCPDISKLSITKKPRLSTERSEKKRFKPKH